MLCLLMARPLHDIAYFPIQMLVINTVAAIEKRNEFAYIVNQEFAFLVGRWGGCGLFIVLANQVSDTFALRYALLIIGVTQLIAIPVAKWVLRHCAVHTLLPVAELQAEDKTAMQA
jgi:MFS transporter, YQGE family, putative transporter